MGLRADRVPLSKAQFKLTPTKLELSPHPDSELENLESLYQRCHMLVFDRPPADRLCNLNASQTIDAATKELNCSARVFMLSAMLAFREMNQNQTFYANMLLGPAAVRKLNVYREACVREFGCFDALAMTRLYKTTPLLGHRLLPSEVQFGAFVLGHRLRSSGDPYQLFYAQHELAQYPTWLAIEPTYAEYLATAGTTQELKRHRHAVSLAHGELKRHKLSARVAFEAREMIMSLAISSVLTTYGISPDHLLVANTAVVDIGRMWCRVALAIQQFHILRHLDGAPLNMAIGHITRGNI